MDEIRTLTFKWETGHIDIARASVLDMNAAQLKKFLKAATINRAEMEDEIRDFINEEIAVLDPKACKKLIENCKKLLAVVEGKILHSRRIQTYPLFCNSRRNRKSARNV